MFMIQSLAPGRTITQTRPCVGRNMSEGLEIQHMKLKNKGALGNDQARHGRPHQGGPGYVLSFM